VQTWIRLHGFDHELPRIPDAGLHLWVEVVGDVGDVDGQLTTYGVDAFAIDDWYCDDAHAVDALHLSPFPGRRPDLIVGPSPPESFRLMRI